MTEANYLAIVRHYERCLKAHGATHKGVDWPNMPDLETRYRVMLNVCMADHGASILDLGCGYGGLLSFMQQQSISENVSYAGVDISSAMIAEARKQHPEHSFEAVDILASSPPSDSVDYVIMNGVLTEKQSLSHEEMLEYARTLIAAAYRICRKAVAFNVMNSEAVQWERDDLFYVGASEVASVLQLPETARVEIAADYGLYEFTTYVHKAPKRGRSASRAQGAR